MEFLKELLGEQLYNQVAEKLKGNDKVKLANLAAGEYVGKDKFSAAESAKKQLEDQLAERDKQLESLKKAAGDNEALKTQIAQLQADNTAAQDDFKKQLTAKQIDFAIEARLLKEGAVNTKAVRALLDNSKISLDGDNVVGLDDQLKQIKDSEKWAFKPITPPASGGNPADGPKPEPKPLPPGVNAF